jgi:putative tryptophan/tyrosine transport system substrate-binding protein
LSEAARVHHAAWRRGSRMAAGGARAAAREAADHRIPRCNYSFVPEAMDGCFTQRLRELGWIEGRTVTIEYRWAEGQLDRSTEIVAEIVRRNVDIIVTHSAEPVLAAKQATSVIPIVFAAAAEPLGSGLVASLARPGGNVTGLSVQSTDLAGKRIEVLREVLPGVRRLGIIANIGAPAAVLEMREVQAAASAVGLAATTFEIRRTDDIASAIDALKDRADDSML